MSENVPYMDPMGTNVTTSFSCPSDTFTSWPATETMPFRNAAMIGRHRWDAWTPEGFSGPLTLNINSNWYVFGSWLVLSKLAFVWNMCCRLQMLCCCSECQAGEAWYFSHTPKKSKWWWKSSVQSVPKCNEIGSDGFTFISTTQIGHPCYFTPGGLRLWPPWGLWLIDFSAETRPKKWWEVATIRKMLATFMEAKMGPTQNSIHGTNGVFTYAFYRKNQPNVGQ